MNENLPLLEWAAEGFAAAGSPARLNVLRLLVRAGDNGIQTSDIGEALGIPPTTLAHHLKSLAGAELITQQKSGRAVINRAAYARIQALADFLLNECCADAREQGEDIPHDHTHA